MMGVPSGFYYGGGGPECEMNNGTDGNLAGAGDNDFNRPVAAEFQKVQSILVDGGDRFGVSAVMFDLQEELVWMGNRGGHVTSYYGSNLEKYTSFQITANQEVRQILSFDDIILILSETQLRGQLRRGIPAFTHLSENFVNMQCMLQTSHSTVLLGGHQETLVEYDLAQNVETKTMYIGGSGCAILRGQGLNRICAGQTSGQVYLLDSRTYRKEHTIEAHSSSLSDLDIHGNLLVTCGFSNRHGSCSLDRFLKIYDLRSLRALAPIQVSIDPIMLRFLPSFSSRIAALSPSGQMEILETQALSTANIMIYQATSNNSECRAFDVSSLCHHMAFGDENGTLNLLSSNPSAMFNPFSRDTEFADPVEQFPPMSVMDESACMASIPLPFQPLHEALLSDWPQHLTHPGYRRHPDIDPSILQSMKMVGPIGYAPNPGTFRRNQMQYKFDPKSIIGGTMPNIKLPLSSPSSISRTSSKFSPNSPNQFSITSPPGRSHSRPHYQHPHNHSHSHSLPHSHNTSPRHSRPIGQQSNNSTQSKFLIPKRYARFDWKKSSFELADMEPFNKTKFSGLEAITVNSYCNSMIQILFHIDYLRGYLISHLCKKEACLSCELGFLFYMMDKSKCLPCAGSNFLRAFRVVPEASALGLIKQESQAKQRSSSFRLAQSWNRFILHQIETETVKSEETGSTQIHDDAISKLFAMKQDNMNKCTRCNREAKKESTVLLSNLLYSLDATGNGNRCKFVEILQRSLYPEQTTPAWCDQCEKYQPTFQSRAPKALPVILSLNTCLDNAHDFTTWKQYLETMIPQKQEASSVSDSNSPPSAAPGHLKSCRYGIACARPDCKFWHEERSTFLGEIPKPTEFDLNPETQVNWIPSKIRVTIGDNGRVSVIDLDTVTSNPAPISSSDLASDYELTGVVIFVKNSENEDKNNLVAILRVDPPFFERSGQTNGHANWYLFNDFYIKEVPMSEALAFNPKWKIPSVVYYQRVPLPESVNSFPILPTVTIDVFRELSKAKEYGKNKNKPLTYTPLGSDEIPQKGELVAIDAEFVTLGQEETELRSDGKLATVKPQQLSLARVTCLRGQGPLEGTPFLDDYISTQEVVVDYLTKFSGIQPGDLDANFSSKNVTGLKSVYLKLRYLSDSGVKFVGHGLSNDFRVINLVVPQEQVIDTVNLFYLPNQRMVSLRFLAWHFLGEVIQSDTHDSAEDARAALALYRKHVELKESGTFEKALEDLYEMGVKLQWKVNGSDK